MNFYKGQGVYHTRWGWGFVLLPKVGNGIQCKFFEWPCPFVVQLIDLEIIEA